MTTTQHRSLDMYYNNTTDACVDPSELGGMINFNQSPVLDKGKGRLQQPQAPSTMTSPSNSVIPFDINEDSQHSIQPSHNYGQYRQQLGLPPNAGQMPATPQVVFPNYNTGISDSQSFDGMPLSSTYELNSPSDFNFEQFIENDVYENTYFKQEEPQAPVRVYPGMNQQQAAMEMMRRQKQLQLEAEQDRRSQASRRSASHASLDQKTEATISRVMSEIRRSSHIAADAMSPPNGQVSPHIIRAKKDEDDMDEDERLLNSEEGKKLSSKERRQLRNKVSARAFRSRRKEYIGQLEGEVAAKAKENSELQRLNNALMQENARYKVLAEKLLSHAAFHPFLEELSRDPALAETLSSVSNSVAQSNQQQMPKDVDPFASTQQFIPTTNTDATVGMTLIPEMPLDLSSLNIGSQNGWTIPSSRAPMGQFVQHQVFAVTEVSAPAEPIDFAALSGKDSEDVFSDLIEEEKPTYPEIDAPLKNEEVIEERPVEEEATEAEEIYEDEEDMVLFAPVRSSKKTIEPVEHENLFGEIAPEKAFAHIELFISSEQDNQLLLDTFERMCARLDARCSRIENLMANL